MKITVKYFLIGLILHLYYFPLFGQQNKIDSLLSLLKTAKKDTGKVNMLNDLAFAFYSSNPDSTILLAKQASELAHKLGFKKGEAFGYYYMGVGCWVQGNYPNALKNYFSSIKIEEEVLQPHTNENVKNGWAANAMAKHLNSVGMVYRNQGDYPKAIEYFFKALKMAEEQENKQSQANILGNIGLVYKNQNDYPKALEHYFKALTIAKELGDKSLITTWIGNIGGAYYGLGNYSKALEFFLNALGMAKELENRNLTAHLLANIGNVYQNQGDSAYVKGNTSFALTNKYSKALEFDNIVDFSTHEGKEWLILFVDVNEHKFVLVT